MLPPLPLTVKLSLPASPVAVSEPLLPLMMNVSSPAPPSR
jgi:hypothetical protein